MTLVGRIGAMCGFAVASALGCSVVADFRDALPRECSTLADCLARQTECRIATACEAGLCVLRNEIDGFPVVEQHAGDCVEVVCDGAGATRLEVTTSDVPDDGDPCTFDACQAATPAHTLATELPCYTGPPATLGHGICTGGVQTCDAAGEPIGGCEGEYVPTDETCASLIDDDCDGKVNEEGDGCVCVPGTLMPCYEGPLATEGVGACHVGMQSCNPSGLGYGNCIGSQKPSVEKCDDAGLDEDCDGESNEEGPDCCGDGNKQAAEACDDGNNDSTDACTESCELAACGDGYWQPDAQEECDDANSSSTDGCTDSCSVASCSDGWVQPGIGESCDDGNLIDGDGCSMTCQNEPLAAIAVQIDSACVMTATGIVKCWGLNSYGQLGLGNKDDMGDQPGEMGASLPAVHLGTDRHATAITALFYSVCAILDDLSLKCWGRNEVGQLGLDHDKDIGDQPGEMGDDLDTVFVGAGRTVVEVVAGGWHTCARLDDGSVKCWGRNEFGQLGLGHTLTIGDETGEMEALLPVGLGTGRTAVGITAGRHHTCVLLDDGSVKCWGYNGYGNLGIGSTDHRGDGWNEMGDDLPTVDLGANAVVTKIESRGYHTCALLQNGSLKCWGTNTNGQLGIENTTGTKMGIGDTPAEMGNALEVTNLGSATVVAVRGAPWHNCAILSDGGTKCWGTDYWGEVGCGDDCSGFGGQLGQMGNALPYVDLGAGLHATMLGASSYQSCAILDDHSVKCWGSGFAGALGTGNTNHLGDNDNEMGDDLLKVNLFSVQ